MSRFAVAVFLVLSVPAAAYGQAPRKVAFLVGVGEFRHDLPDLKGSPQKDVTELAGVFRDGGFRTVVVTDKDATRSAIEARFQSLLEGDATAPALAKGDVLVVVVCTHGFTLPPAAGKKDEPFVAGYDARPGDPKTMVSLNGLIDTANPFGATTLFLVDACREITDPNRGATRGIEGVQVVLPRGTAVLFSCGRGQLSHQNEKAGGHGLFTFAVLKALRGETGLKGEVSWSRLVSEVESTFRSKELRDLIPPSKPQTPFEPKGELAFTDLLRINPLAGDWQKYREAVRYGNLRRMADLFHRLAPERLPDWRKAAAAGDPFGQFFLAQCLEHGHGVEKNPAEAAALYRKAADGGHAIATFCLGWMHENGVGVPQDRKKAAELYRQSADAGEPIGMRGVGTMYYHGIGVQRDLKAAFEWHKKGAAGGDAVAMNNLARAYSRGEGVEQNGKLAFEWYKKSADLETPFAISNLGLMYAIGRGVEKDEAKAVEYYRKSAALGDPLGMGNLAITYRDGRGIEKDLTQAREWFQKAADLGDAGGMTQLGDLYERGVGVGKDAAKAFEWYAKAAAAGDVPILTHIGWMYETGTGVGKDEAKAFEWYGKAAAAGDVHGMSSLGNLYERGVGVAKDVTKAAEWYKKAADLGDDGAKNALKRLGNE